MPPRRGRWPGSRPDLWIATAPGSQGDPGVVRLAERARNGTAGRDPDVLRSLAPGYAIGAEVARHLASYEAGRAVR